MDTLRDFYKTNLIRLIFLGGVAAFIFNIITPGVIAFVTPQVTQYFLNDDYAKATVQTGFNLLTAVVLGLFLFVGEWLIRTRWWKVFHHDLDFSGKWVGATKYSNLEIESANLSGATFTPFSSDHKIMIKQDCTKIAIVPTPGDKFVNWWSIAISITENKGLAYVYKVDYKKDTKFPERFPTDAIGYEIMEVQPSVKDTPMIMSGKFYHCAKHPGPIYSGETTFVRCKYRHLITSGQLDDYATDLLTDDCS